jgi:hypothetical protein
MTMVTVRIAIWTKNKNNKLGLFTSVQMKTKMAIMLQVVQRVLNITYLNMTTARV